MQEGGDSYAYAAYAAGSGSRTPEYFLKVFHLSNLTNMTPDDKILAQRLGPSDYYRAKARVEVQSLLALSEQRIAPPLTATCRTKSRLDGKPKIGALLMPLSTVGDLYSLVECQMLPIAAHEPEYVRATMWRLLHILDTAHGMGYAHGDVKLEQAIFDSWSEPQARTSPPREPQKPSDSKQRCRSRSCGRSAPKRSILSHLQWSSPGNASQTRGRVAERCKGPMAPVASIGDCVDAPDATDGTEGTVAPTRLWGGCGRPAPESLVLTDWSVGRISPSKDGSLPVRLDQMCHCLHSPPEVSEAVQQHRRDHDPAAGRVSPAIQPLTHAARAVATGGAAIDGAIASLGAKTDSDPAPEIFDTTREICDGVVASESSSEASPCVLPVSDGDVASSVEDESDEHARSLEDTAGACAGTASRPGLDQPRPQGACADSAPPMYLQYVDARKLDTYGAGVIFAFLLTRRGVGVDVKSRESVLSLSHGASPEAVDLLLHLTAFDHACRPTAAEALASPYFAPLRA